MITTRYNIHIIQQCSPEVNTLDLGILVSVQATVDSRHQDRGREPDRLAATMRQVWINLVIGQCKWHGQKYICHLPRLGMAIGLLQYLRQSIPVIWQNDE